MTEEITDENVKAAIRSAAKSLARCEQCRVGLERKLAQKEFPKDAVMSALNFLEERGYLSDERYAASWIRTHCSVKSYGKLRLLRELTARGVSKAIAENAIEDYFITHTERELCMQAFSKLRSQGKSEQKIMRALIDKGFSYTMIQKLCKNGDGAEYVSE